MDFNGNLVKLCSFNDYVKEIKTQGRPQRLFPVRHKKPDLTVASAAIKLEISVGVKRAQGVRFGISLHLTLRKIGIRLKKIAKNLTFFSKKLPKFFFQKNCQWQFF